MRLADVPGWAGDTDVWLGPPLDWRVCFVRVQPLPLYDIVQAAMLTRYARAYRLYGPMALPPIIVYGDPSGWSQATGAHRMTAAHKAGLDWIPAWYAYPPDGRPPAQSYSLEVMTA